MPGLRSWERCVDCLNNDLVCPHWNNYMPLEVLWYLPGALTSIYHSDLRLELFGDTTENILDQQSSTFQTL